MNLLSQQNGPMPMPNSYQVVAGNTTVQINILCTALKTYLIRVI